MAGIGAKSFAPPSWTSKNPRNATNYPKQSPRPTKAGASVIQTQLGTKIPARTKKTKIPSTYNNTHTANTYTHIARSIHQYTLYTYTAPYDPTESLVRYTHHHRCSHRLPYAYYPPVTGVRVYAYTYGFLPILYPPYNTTRLCTSEQGVISIISIGIIMPIISITITRHAFICYINGRKTQERQKTPPFLPSPSSATPLHARSSPSAGHALRTNERTAPRIHFPTS